MGVPEIAVGLVRNAEGIYAIARDVDEADLHAVDVARDVDEADLHAARRGRLC